ncbi:NUDIX hydrolase [Synechocystis sp. CACIAM 05]|nr:NUDIX hydrolase [Synechocystis sp. CACIAM 05]
MHSVTISLVVKTEDNLLMGDRQEVSKVKAFAVEDLPLGALSHDHDQQLQDFLRGETIIA